MTSSFGKRRAEAKKKAAKKRLEPNYDKRMKEICEAAARVFNEKGYRGTSISSVAKEMNVGRATLYYYISSKEQLFEELVRDVSVKNLEIAKEIQAKDLSPENKLRELIIELMESYGRHYPILYIYVRENHEHVSDKSSKWAKFMRKLSHEYDEAVISIIEEGYKDGSFKNVGSAKIVTYGILNMLGGTSRWFKPQPNKVSAREVGEIYADLIIGGLKA